jgi:drug/metabolite transporter (DMT)-like permease
MSSPAPFRENLRGIASISLCNLVFLIGDTLIKLASAELPLGEMILLRGATATALLAPIVVISGVRIAPAMIANRALLLRTIAEIASSYLYFICLFHTPIANTNTILQVVPLMVTAAAALILAERVGWRRWTAIAIGFAGVLIVVRPGLAGFNSYSLFALASAAFIAMRDMATRIMPAKVPTLLIGLVTAAAVGASGPFYGLAMGEQWLMPSGHALLLIAGAAVFLIGGYLTAIDFMRHGDIAVVAPFRYTVIIWAVISGFLVWGEVPDAPMVIGTLVIIGTGVYTFHRERRLAMRATAAAAAAPDRG